MKTTTIPYLKGSKFFCVTCQRKTSGEGFLANLGEGLQPYCKRHYWEQFPLVKAPKSSNSFMELAAEVKVIWEEEETSK